MRLPSFVLKKWLKEIFIRDHNLEMRFYFKRQNLTIKEFLDSIIIWIDKSVFFDNQIYPIDFDIVVNGTLYKNESLAIINNYRIQAGDMIRFIVPNRTNISSGRHKIYLGSHGYSIKTSFKIEIQTSKKKLIEQKSIPITKQKSIPMTEKKSISKLLKITYYYALFSVIFYEILLIFSSQINYLYFFIPALFIAFFFSVYYINRQRNLARYPRPIRKKWYSSKPDWFWLVLGYSFIFSLLLIIPWGIVGLLFATIIPCIIASVFFFRTLSRNALGDEIEKSSRKIKNREIIIKGLLIGFVLIPLVILYIVFLSIMTAIILLLPGIFYYLYNNRQKMKLQKKHEFLILFIIILLSITPIVLERTLIRNNYQYIEDYNVESGVPDNLISISESFDPHQKLNWSTTGSLKNFVFPNERIVYKNKIHNHKNQFFIPYLHSKELFRYSFSAKPISTSIIINYTINYGYFEYSLNDLSFNISGDNLDENYFARYRYCFCYFYINSSLYNPPSNASESASFSSGFLVTIDMTYEYQPLILYMGGDKEQKHVIILNEEYEILFVLIVSSMIQYVDVSGCGC
ncbi:MAG: hypothetical protein ACFFB0_17790 [Promethearchaeota archaeon]